MCHWLKALLAGAFLVLALTMAVCRYQHHNVLFTALNALLLASKVLDVVPGLGSRRAAPMAAVSVAVSGISFLLLVVDEVVLRVGSRTVWKDALSVIVVSDGFSDHRFSLIHGGGCGGETLLTGGATTTTGDDTDDVGEEDVSAQQ